MKHLLVVFFVVFLILYMVGQRREQFMDISSFYKSKSAPNVWLNTKPVIAPQNLKQSSSAQCVNAGNHWVGKCIPPNNTGVNCVIDGKHWVNSKCVTKEEVKAYEEQNACAKYNDIYSNGTCIKRSDFLKKQCQCPACAACPVCPPREAAFQSQVQWPNAKDLEEIPAINTILNNGIDGKGTMGDDGKWISYDSNSTILGSPSDSNNRMQLRNNMKKLTPHQKYIVVNILLTNLKTVKETGGHVPYSFENYIDPAVFMLYHLGDHVSDTGKRISIGKELAPLITTIYDYQGEQ